MRAFEASNTCLFEEQHLLCACAFTYVKIIKKNLKGWLPFPAEISVSWELFVEVNVSLLSCSVIFIERSLQ